MQWRCLAGPAVAADVAKVGKCLLGNCQVVLAKCLADGECVENLICLQLCNGRPDETACQVSFVAIAGRCCLLLLSQMMRHGAAVTVLS